jgi:hypothetical protein
VPEDWQRAEARDEGRRDELKLAGLALIVLAAVTALVLAVIAWSKGRSDRRAFWWVVGLSLLTMYAGNANNWTARAMQLRTAEPLADQLLLTVLGALAGGLLMALLFGLLAGVGAYYARAQVASRPAVRVAPWLLGVAAALAAAGIAAALGALVPAAAPLWPDVKFAGYAWPLGGAVTAGLAVVPALAVTLFLLSVVDRATARWTRRLPAAALVIVLLGVALAIVSGRDVGHALLQGVAEGGAAFVLAWLVLRYDLRTVPAFVATGMVLEAVRSAALSGAGGHWVLPAVSAVVTVLAAWAATRYVVRPPAPSAP